ncbi:MAG: hypothetical protein QOH09_4215 [Pseudonocardiales bacterium]|jgi:hypothetical protein|nr:hypothetical protein [Pseudonocardiales bacterium]
MTEDLDVSVDIARRVRAGELGSGAELWSVRSVTSARAWACSPSRPARGSRVQRMQDAEG